MIHNPNEEQETMKKNRDRNRKPQTPKYTTISLSPIALGGLLGLDALELPGDGSTVEALGDTQLLHALTNLRPAEVWVRPHPVTSPSGLLLVGDLSLDLFFGHKHDIDLSNMD
jgi:hypothetical protein